MHSGHRTMTAFLTVILGLLLVIIGLIFDWPLWAWPIVAGALLVGAAASLVVTHRRKPYIPPERLLEPDVQPVERWERMIKQVSLPSLEEDYDFQFSATVRWRPLDAPANAPVVNPGGLAIEAILDRVRHITRQAPPHRSSLTEHHLNGALATMLPDPSNRVVAMAENVQLSLSDSDRDRLEKLATVRKDEAVWEHERKWEQNRRAYLSGDVLKTPGSAVVWWLAKNDERVDKTVSDIGLLAELSSAANNIPVPEDFHRFVPGLAALRVPGTAVREEARMGPRTPDEYVEELLQGTGLDEDDPRRELFIKRIADAARGAGLHEVAEVLERRRDAFASTDPAYEPSPDHDDFGNPPFDEGQDEFPPPSQDESPG
ncbi:hypothetical protein GCM10022403_015700 [Streptomyces coacervatus]|uniref:Uncharacterized protein n=1 Tax=Streptomyces coacervatus TaxID=647381 RepID=A0ABP7H4Q0_9ACTN|nr:hypothetical protein [Streptomyces coacervatus]MDF2267858.1 hypothetical protein [Streptomyces coacervatus]